MATTVFESVPFARAHTHNSAQHRRDQQTHLAPHYRPLALLSFLLFAACSSHAVPIAPKITSNHATPNLAVLYDEIAPRLISGGTFVYFVPFPTIGDANAQTPEVWRDCSVRVLVSAVGLEQAQLVNNSLKSLPVTISYAQTGDSCLAMSSLRYLLSRIGTVLVSTNDFDPYDILRTRARDPVLASQIQAQFTNSQPDATKLMVGSRMAQQVAPHPVLASLAPGESAIFVESGADHPILLARLTPYQWAEMAHYWRHRAARANITARSVSRKQASPSIHTAPSDSH